MEETHSINPNEVGGTGNCNDDDDDVNDDDYDDNDNTTKNQKCKTGLKFYNLYTQNSF